MSEAILPSAPDPTQAPFPQPTKLSRRMRPPDLDIKSHMEDRQPLRSDKHTKAAWRESRLGLGKLFGRHRMAHEAEAAKAAREATEPKKPGEVIETIGGLPYDLQPKGMQSEIQLVPAREHDFVARPKTAGLRSPTSAPLARSPALVPNGKRWGAPATPSTSWDPIPLFQAYPQAVRTATLPACVQADSLLKAHHKREMASTINHPDLGDDMAMFLEMAKKKNRRNSSSFKFDWTKKIYVLLTSGYVLQYAGDGPHDCLPEKAVQLTKHSAAFASDVIPGKHWVLQVSSVFEEGGLTSQDTRSLLGKFGLREKERRQASDILMVFENAADMDSWMSLLRREIELLGGKTPVTETGAPRCDGEKETAESLPVSPTSPARRTLVVRDPHRFARNGSMPDMRWDAAATFDGPELHLDAFLAEFSPEHADDKSTTNSFVSHDGRQLDGLRDGSNRYSFMSAARTIVTSDSSACNSPIRDSFGSGSQGSHPSEDTTPLADDFKDVRPRPNAAEIEDRRQSYRTSNIFLDSNGQLTSHRQHSSLPCVQETPNFSLPKVAARRRAVSQNGKDAVPAGSTTSSRPPRRPRRPPPPTLGFTRPLSVVADSPSPSRASAHTPLITGDGLAPSPSSPSLFSSWNAEDTRPEYDLSPEASNRTVARTSLQTSVHAVPRKCASTNSLRPTDNTFACDATQFNQPFGSTIRDASPSRRALDVVAEVPRSMTSMDVYSSMPASPLRSRSPIQRAMAAQKRASMYSPSSSPQRGSFSSFMNNTAHRATQSDHHLEQCRSPAASPGLPPQGDRRESLLSIHRHSRNGSNSSEKSFLSNRRSLSQIPQLQAKGLANLPPPPAPPPNKALPPIPTDKLKRRSGSIPPPVRVGMGGAF